MSELRGIQAFAPLSEADLERIVACATVRRARAGYEIELVRQGLPVVCFSIDAEFNLTLMAPSGRQVIVRMVRPGGQFGEERALGVATPSDTQAICIVNGDYLEISGVNFRRLVRECPALALNLLEAIAASAAGQVERIYELSVLDLRAKLRAEILRVARETDDGEEQVYIPRPPTHEQFASLIGATREGVTREMRALADQGIIRFGRRELTVLSVSRLRNQLAMLSGTRALRAHALE